MSDVRQSKKENLSLKMETLYSTCTVIRESGLSARQLYYWENIGLIEPRYETFGMRRFRRYSQNDLDLLKMAKAMLDQGYTLQAIKQTVHMVQEQTVKFEEAVSDVQSTAVPLAKNGGTSL